MENIEIYKDEKNVFICNPLELKEPLDILEWTLLEMLGPIDDKIIHDVYGITDVNGIMYDSDKEFPYRFFYDGQEVDVDVNEMLKEIWSD